MIASLDVAKINAGDFSTTKFRIVSDSGKMLISDNTIQISDNNRVRVQIGKDASNDYNMYVWDSAGKLMFDATGLKADGIKNKIIRDDMISDTANIAGSKINISSLIAEINKDTNTSVIKSSKVQLDTVGQTLEVAFTSLKSNVDNMEIGGRNLLLNSGVEVTNNNYGTNTYIPSELFVEGETYTVTLCVTPAENVQSFRPYLSSGMASQCILSVNGTSKQIISATFKAHYYSSNIPTKPTDGHARMCFYRFPNNGTVTSNSTIHWVKVEKGNKATDWTPAPEDTDNSIESVKQITESNSTTINVMQGQIATAINNTQIVKDGQNILLKDDYNRTVTLVNSINSTIGIHSTKINELTGSISSVDTKVNSVQRDLEGTKSTVSSHTSHINGLNLSLIHI